MNEGFVKETEIEEKTDEQRKIDLIKNIIKTKTELGIANKNFEYAEDEMIDYYSYQIKAIQAKLNYLIKIAKKQEIVLDVIEEAEIRLDKAI